MVLTNLDLFDIVEEIQLKDFIGVFMKDELLNEKKKVGNYIINLQSSTDGNGTHYTALKIYPNGSCLYFDSFGFDSPIEVKKFCGCHVPYSDKQIQNINSSICGYYAISFLYYMSSHENKNYLDVYEKYLNMFSNDVKQNRKILENYLRPL